MNYLDFPETNRTMKAGDNPMTRSLRVAVCYHPDISDKIPFCISKWEMTEQERQRQKERFMNILRNFDPSELSHEKVAEIMIQSMAPIYLSVMHGQAPVHLFAGGQSPFEFGYIVAQVGPAPVDPKDN